MRRRSIIKGLIFALVLLIVAVSKVTAQTYPNQPAGLSPITERPFSANNESGWVDHSGMNLFTDATAPVSPSAVVRVVYPEGYVGGGSPAVSETSFPLPRPQDIYWSLHFKFSNPWTTHIAGSKIHYIWAPSGGRWTAIVMPTTSDRDGPMHMTIHLFGSRTADNPDDVTIQRPPAGICLIQRGQWHHVEIFSKMNTGANFDGWSQFWMDGVLCSDRRDVRHVWTEEESHVFSIAQFEPVYGGGVEQTVPQEQYQYYDHTYISGGVAQIGGDTLAPAAPSNLRVVTP